MRTRWKVARVATDEARGVNTRKDRSAKSV